MKRLSSLRCNENLKLQKTCRKEEKPVEEPKMKIKKIMKEDDAKKLAEMIIEYAEEHELTISNVNHVMKLVKKHMERNAVLK